MAWFILSSRTTWVTRGLVFRVAHDMRTHRDKRLILFKTLQEKLCCYGVADGTSKVREAYRSCRCIGEFQAAITQIGTLLGCRTLEEVKWLQAILNDDVILYEEYLREEQHQKHVSDQQAAAAADTATEEEIVESLCKKLSEEDEEEFEEEEEEGGEQQCNAKWNRKKENSSPKVFQMDEINN